MKLLLTLDKERIDKSKKLEEVQSLRVRFEFYGVKVHVCTNSLYLANHLRLGYRFFEIPDGNGEPCISLLALQAGGAQFHRSVKALFPSRTVREHVLVAQELGLIFLLDSRPLFAYYTVKVLFGLVIHHLRKRFLAFHAATLSHQGHGLILCGAARCGKTLLSALLMDQDFTCCSDDVTLMRRADLQGAPFPRALNIRREYESLLAPLLAKTRQQQRFQIADQERLLVDIGHSPPETVEPRAICLPRFEPDGDTRLEQMSPSTALVSLMHHRFHPLDGPIEKYDDEDFEFFSRLVTRVPCFTLTYADPMEAALKLKDLFSGQ